ncbi:SET domain-containing protein [Cryptococcus neoformans]|nr:SET domain-containing protein [Cryptococcus neoformans var. grubii]OXC57739.1 SET domain-containing protein [Cryptococcus neoformans var. grubii MW-RSA852]
MLPIQKDISMGAEPLPIPISHLSTSIRHFTYITDSELGHVAPLSITHPLLPDCDHQNQPPSSPISSTESGSSSDAEDVWTCTCASYYESEKETSLLCTAECGDLCDCVAQFGNFYSSTNPQILNLDALPNNWPLVECSPSCLCGSSCSNRVTQQGVRTPLTIRPTPPKGYGLFYTPSTPQFLPRGAFISLYAGEYILPSEIRSRWSPPSTDPASDKEGYGEEGQGNYILSLRLPDQTIHIDPRWKGNVGRFLNHSCGANCVVHYVKWGGGQGWPRAAIFTNRDIHPEEELTFDYSNASGEPQRAIELIQESKTQENTKGRTRCLCGAEQCRGWMPFDETL